ncbi:MAG: DNA topoisomerase [Agitococcus sp.]|nr:DNA topoisomerase [Agitococcus sp.]
MTTLYIAEKKSQAQDIANAIGVKRMGDGCIELTTGDCITWARGHLLELATPEEHNPAWGGRWTWAQLPMIPDKWKYNVNKKTAEQFRIIVRLVKEATAIVLATDAGREGELIGREILEYCKYKGPIKRLWTSSLVESDILHALQHLKPGAETYPLYEAALARQHCDNLFGLTGTRAASLAANVHKDYFPMGRVQTPTLALVVRRVLEIKNFQVNAFYELEAKVRTASGKDLIMKHAPEGDNKITSKEEATRLKKLADKAKAPLKVVKASESETAPLPYSLPALQADANRLLGFSAKTTLEHAQKLYELKTTTYPRTDCQHLAASQKRDVEQVLSVVARRFDSQVRLLQSKGVTKRDSTFDDSKLTDHHGILPTSLFVHLEGPLLQLYTLICQRYLQMLAPDCRFNATRVQMNCNSVLFKASGKVITEPGWRGISLLG